MAQSWVPSTTVGLVALQPGEWGLGKGGDSRLTEGERGTGFLLQLLQWPGHLGHGGGWLSDWERGNRSK